DVVAADPVRLPGGQAGLFVDAPGLTHEADEHRDDPGVHDVAAVAAATLGDETPESAADGLVIVALRGCSLAGPYPSIKLLEDHGDVEAHQRYGRERQRLLQRV